jgi:hypothetical protein
MDKQTIKDLALSNGFKLKEQRNSEFDLNPYVYDFANELVAKANERVKELEELNLELSVNVEACCELTEMEMGAAIERLLEIDNTESKELVNKFAIEQKIEALKETSKDLCNSAIVPKASPVKQDYYKAAIRHCIHFIEAKAEQLRKEQE